MYVIPHRRIRIGMSNDGLRRTIQKRPNLSDEVFNEVAPLRFRPTTSVRDFTTFLLMMSKTSKALESRRRRVIEPREMTSQDEDENFATTKRRRRPTIY